MNDDGVIFADGVEQDVFAFDWSLGVTITPAARTLRLISG